MADLMTDDVSTAPDHVDPADWLPAAAPLDMPVQRLESPRLSISPGRRVLEQGPLRLGHG